MKPLLKWAGGKRWLLPVLQDVWAAYPNRKLVEPFTGGMAVALGLNPTTALLNDANQHLINFYIQVSKGLEIGQQFKNNSIYYYAQRNKFNKLILKNQHQTEEAASIFYFLIRTGFNGLCRFNSDGEFNVPFGQHAKILYSRDFAAYRQLFNQWQLTCTDFAKLQLDGDEFLYVDPPYDVEFTRYNAKDFLWDDQIRLVNWLVKHKGPVIASNQATPRVLELYKGLKFTVCCLPAPRMISCNGDRRPAIEMLAFKGVKPGVIRNLRAKTPGLELV